MILKIKVEAENCEMLNTLLDILKEKYEKVLLIARIDREDFAGCLMIDQNERIEDWDAGMVAKISAWNGELECEKER